LQKVFRGITSVESWRELWNIMIGEDHLLLSWT